MARFDGRANLIPSNKRSMEEVRKNSSIGGKKSVEVRRRKKTWGEIANIFLSSTNISEASKVILEKYGLDKSEATIEASIIYNLILKAQKENNLDAFKELKDITGNAGVKKIDASVNSENKEIMKEYLESLKNDK